eukprot:Hpha_TRINITY_DN20009_c0_g1::TRINITY_DN20009_c0_g1_i1::g.147805::m.147805
MLRALGAIAERFVSFRPAAPAVMRQARWESSGTELPPHLAQVRDAVSSGAGVMVDVREQGEWNQGHLTGAVYCPLSGLMRGPPPDLPQDATLYLYCRAGQRVYMAAPILQRAGYEKVVPLDEGFLELVDLGFEHQ